MRGNKMDSLDDEEFTPEESEMLADAADFDGVLNSDLFVRTRSTTLSIEYMAALCTGSCL